MYPRRSARALLPLRALLLGLCAGLACTLAWLPAGDVQTGASLDALAPLPATLLPRVHIIARVGDPESVQLQVEEARPQPVSLRPTLRVVAQAAVEPPAEARAAPARTATAAIACRDPGRRPMPAAAQAPALARC